MDPMPFGVQANNVGAKDGLRDDVGMFGGFAVHVGDRLDDHIVGWLVRSGSALEGDGWENARGAKNWVFARRRSRTIGRDNLAVRKRVARKRCHLP